MGRVMGRDMKVRRDQAWRRKSRSHGLETQGPIHLDFRSCFRGNGAALRAALPLSLFLLCFGLGGGLNGEAFAASHLKAEKAAAEGHKTAEDHKTAEGHKAAEDHKAAEGHKTAEGHKAADHQPAGGKKADRKSQIKTIKIEEGIEIIEYLDVPESAEKSRQRAKDSQAEEKVSPQGEEGQKADAAKTPAAPKDASLPASAAAGGETSETPKNTVSETLNPEKEKSGEERGILIPDLKLSKGYSWMEDYSWFFEKRKTKHKFGIVPSYYRTRIYGSNLGLRAFLYSPDETGKERHGYYLAVSVLSQIPSFRFFGADVQYVENYKSGLEAQSSVFYSNYFEPYYGEGINTKESDREDLYASRVKVNYKILRRRPKNIFYGFSGQLIFRSEHPQQNKGGKEKFASEFLLNLKALLGYDSRDSWKDSLEGQFVQLSFGCVPSLGHGSSFCLGDLDARSWLTYYSWTLALRGFIGSSFFARTSYSTAYTLGGPKVLRGFPENRFRGDKIYFGQAELRRPLWGKFLSGVVFAEIGEVAKYGENLFQSYRWDYGFGLRFGIPPSYKIKLRADAGVSTDKEDKNRLNITVGFLQAF